MSAAAEAAAEAAEAERAVFVFAIDTAVSAASTAISVIFMPSFSPDALRAS
jgi:hypothetical protein